MPIRQVIADVPRTKSIVLGVSALLIGSAVFYAGTAVSAAKPATLSPEWQKATKEYLKFQNMNPISGASSQK
eukprot:gene5369-5906_t